MPASDRMLRGRLPWGLGGAVYLLVRLFARTRLFVRRCEVVDAFCWGSGDVIEYYASMLDHTGALIGEQRSSRYREGVPLVVVFEISPSEKIFTTAPTLTTTTRPYRTLCDVSALALGQRLRFVAVTTYRCRVRFRRPS